MDDGLKAESGQGWLTLHVAVIQATTWRVHYDAKPSYFVTEITKYEYFAYIQSHRVHNRPIQGRRKKTRHLSVAGFGVTKPAEAGWIIRRLPSSR
jgi:hypothetical protein